MDLRVTNLSYLLEAERPTILGQLAIAHCPSAVRAACASLAPSLAPSRSAPSSSSSSAAHTPSGSERKRQNGAKDLLLLDDVSFHCRPGSATVFQGLGLGYKTLLECISLRQLEGLQRGKIELDGHTRSNALYKDVSLIHDLGICAFPALSVFEFLFYSARLRLSLNVAECRERARTAARSAELDSAQVVSSLSPAELRLLDVAAELVSHPSLLCILDATEGLDAPNKLQVMRVLHKIAHDPRRALTVVYNVTTVDSDMIHYVDNLGIFIANRLEYFGRALAQYNDEKRRRLQEEVVRCSWIVFEHSRDCPTAIADEEIRASSYAQRLRTHIEALQRLHARETKRTAAMEERTNARAKTKREEFVSVHAQFLISEQIKALQRQTKPFREEFSILVSRSLAFYRKNGIYWLMGFVRLLIAALVLSALLFSAGDDFQDDPDLLFSSHNLANADAYNVTSLCFLLVALSLLGASFTVSHLHVTVKLLKFEVASGLLSTRASWLSLLVVDLSLSLLASLVIGVLVFFSVRLQGPLFDYLTAIVGVMLGSYSLALTCAVWSNSVSRAVFAFSVCTALSVLFTGYYQRIENLPWLWQWASACVYTRWAFAALLITALRDAQDKENYLSAYSFDTHTGSFARGWLWLWFIALQTVVVVGLLPPWSRFRFEASSTSAGRKRERRQTVSDYYTNMNEESNDNKNSENNTLQERESERGSEAVRERDCVCTETPTQATHTEEHARSRCAPAVIPVPPGMVTTLSFSRIKYFNDDELHAVSLYQQSSMLSSLTQANNNTNNATTNRDSTTTRDSFSSSATLAVSPLFSSPSQTGTQAHTGAGTHTHSHAQKKKRPITAALAESLFTETTLNGITASISPGTACCILDAHAHTHGSLPNNRSSSITAYARSQMLFSAHMPSQTLTERALTGGDHSARTLLHILANTGQATGKTTGVIAANGVRLSRTTSYRNAAFVQRGDVPGCATLTVREILTFAALLRRRDRRTCDLVREFCERRVRMLCGCVEREDKANDPSSYAIDLEDGSLTAYRRMSDEKTPSSPWRAALPASQTTPNTANRSSLPLSRDAELEQEIERIGASETVPERVEEVLRLLGLCDVADALYGEDVLYGDSERDEEDALQQRVHRNKSLSASRALRHLHKETHNRKNNDTNCLSSLFSPAKRTRAQGRRKEQSTLSPGQRRLLSIGVELVNRPGLVFLEDPFFTLQWQEAEMVAQAVQALARGQRTVVCNIARPTDRLLSFFDETLLLGSGLLLYSGPTNEITQHFQSIGFIRASNQSDVDFILDIAAERGKMSASAHARRGTSLSPEDLADLNRSLGNIKAAKRRENSALSALKENVMTRTPSSSSTVSALQRQTSNVSNYEMAETKNTSAATPLTPPTQRLPSHTGTDGKTSLSLVRTPTAFSRNNSVNNNTNNNSATTGTLSASAAVTQNTCKHAPVGPTAITLLVRGVRLVVSDKAAIARYLSQCLLAGLALGSVWFSLPDGEISARVSLFAVLYLVLCALVVYDMGGVFHRKQLFLRELLVDASDFLAYYLVDGVAAMALFACGCFVTLLPVYLLTGLRSTSENFFYLLFLLVVSVWCNYTLAQMLSLLCSSLFVARTVFAGVVLPLQYLASGQLVLLPTLSPSLRTFFAIAPMRHFIAGALRNECQGNEAALGDDVSFDDVDEQFYVSETRAQSVVAVVVTLLVARTVWLIGLRLQALRKERTFRRKVLNIRKRARWTVISVLQWFDSLGFSKRSEQPEEVEEYFEEG